MFNSVENRLLAKLPREEYQRLLPNLETVPLAARQILYTPNEPIEYVYFLKNGLASLLALMEDGSAVEVAAVGNEGMVGIPLFLGAESTPILAICQIPGEAMRMRADIFKQEVAPSSLLYRLLQRYTVTLLNQFAQTAACNSLHSVEKRCCRWLLMTQDRMETDEFQLTQEFLAVMLGVRRASVSTVAAFLQREGYISYSRGRIKILDRKGLESASCECYKIAKAELNRWLSSS